MKKFIVMLLVAFCFGMLLDSGVKAETFLVPVTKADYTFATKRASNPIPSFMNYASRKKGKGSKGGRGKGKKC
jgi:hypothetical protein